MIVPLLSRCAEILMIILMIFIIMILILILILCGRRDGGRRGHVGRNDARIDNRRVDTSLLLG